LNYCRPATGFAFLLGREPIIPGREGFSTSREWKIIGREALLCSRTGKATAGQ